MITILNNSIKLVKYQPLSIKKKLHGFLISKKLQPIFKDYFVGEYDNQNQSLIDYKIWQLGSFSQIHEHIHCSVLHRKYYQNYFDLFEALYYFPYKNPVAFRDRIYLFYPSLFSTEKKIIFQMEILQNNNDMSLNFQSYLNQPKRFLFEKFSPKNNLDRCLIFWNIEYGGILSLKKKPIFFAELLNGGCTIFSLKGSEFLNVKDNLILTENSLWVNDRGFDDKGNKKYGNSEKRAYKLEKISRGTFLNCSIRNIRKKYK